MRIKNKMIPISIFLSTVFFLVSPGFGAGGVTPETVYLALKSRDYLKAYTDATQLIENTGDAVGYYVLGTLYYQGAGVKKDYAQAHMNWVEASNKGLPLAQNNLGSMYEEGIGVSKNCGKAVFWYEKAAESKVSTDIKSLFFLFSPATGLYSLGSLHERGVCVAADRRKAADYYQKSARLGFKPALDAMNRIK